jgi:hypothetical protein
MSVTGNNIDPPPPPRRRGKPTFRKRLLSRYVYWLEAIGFTFIGVLLAGMIGSAIYEIDDAARFTAVPAEPLTVPVQVETDAYVRSVSVRPGDEVEAGAELMTAITDPGTSAQLRALRLMEDALAVLENSGETTGSIQEPLSTAINETSSVLAALPPTRITAPVSGVFFAGVPVAMENLPGRVVSERIGTIRSYKSLQFPVPLSGDNAARVRVNLLAEQDVLDWRALTAVIRTEDPPADPAQRRVWELLAGKLEEVKPGKVPLKRLMPEIVGALNDLLRKRDFYHPEAWRGKGLDQETRTLLEKGIDELDPDELIAVNRKLLEAAFPGIIAVSAGARQVVKAKLLIPVRSQGPDGKIQEEEPLAFPVQGNVVSDPIGGNAIVNLPEVPGEVVEYMQRRDADPAVPPVLVNGTIVVGRISLFRFLFK